MRRLSKNLFQGFFFCVSALACDSRAVLTSRYVEPDSGILIGPAQADGSTDGVLLDAAADAAADGGLPTSLPKRGRLANLYGQNEPILSTLFFAGNARDGNGYYEVVPSDNTHVFTQHPLDNAHLQWSESKAAQFAALDAMVALGLNTVDISYWGKRGDLYWASYAPMQTSTYAHDELFNDLVEQEYPLRVIPFIESHSVWKLRDEFPGTSIEPAPGLIEQIMDLLTRYVIAPENPAWAQYWAKIYDAAGQPRYAITLIHVASNQDGVTDQSFAQGFDWVADRIYAQTGLHVGFLLDVLPADTNAPGAFKPTPQGTGSYLEQTSAVLGIRCFIPEIWLSEWRTQALSAWKANFSALWSETGVPFIQDVTPGYDAGLVFEGSVVYGHTTDWMNAQAQTALYHATAGVTLNSWNGYTEAMVIVPTVERGAVAWDWSKELLSQINAKLH